MGLCSVVMHPDLLALADVVEVVDEHTFIVAGYESSVDPIAPAAAPDRAEHILDPDPAPLPAPTAESSLATLIYERCYVRPSGPDLRVLDHAADREFQLSLFHANGDAAVWESGWNLEPERTNGRVTVSRYGVRFTARPDEVRGTSDGAHARAPCLVRVPTKYQRLLPHFFLILGTAESTTTPGEGIIRLYWHLRSHGAPHWLSQLSRSFNDAHPPFRAKVLASPHAYRRADAGVLYMASRDFSRAQA